MKNMLKIIIKGIFFFLFLTLVLFKDISNNKSLSSYWRDKKKITDYYGCY